MAKISYGKQARILTLLIIDTFFFFAEIIVGYKVQSLALIADSFHMLNDIISLGIAYYAIKLATSPKPAPKLSYGWARAEILGALLNGTFLLALCFSIFLNSIERFANIEIVSDPELVVIVGSVGLAFNILGLFLFGHSHDHGGGGHSHEGHSHSNAQNHPSNEQGSLTNNAVARTISAPSPISPIAPHDLSYDVELGGIGHPSQTRASIVRTAQRLGQGSSSPEGSVRLEHDEDNEIVDQVDGLSPCSHHLNEQISGQTSHSTHSTHSPSHFVPTLQQKSEGSLNISGVFLHVMGDALGNVGVIISGLIIWFAHGGWRYYMDPLVSLFITVIIFCSAFPLVRSASYILLNAIPAEISVQALQNSILEIHEVLSVHELHVWNLSETKKVASVHVLLRAIDSEETQMRIVGRVREILHNFGVHSSTIQVEYRSSVLTQVVEETGALETDCLIKCKPEEGCEEETCCPK